MNKQQLARIIYQAREVCKRSGGRLTEKRQTVLELLLESRIPLSAYEIADGYNNLFAKSIPTMSVYRILEFLESESLVHKLSSANKYVACSHILGGRPHEITQFLICSKCQSAKELSVSEGISDELTKLVDTVGYTLTHSQLELQCLCDNCSASAL